MRLPRGACASSHADCRRRWPAPRCMWGVEVGATAFCRSDSFRALVQSLQSRYSCAPTIHESDWKERHTMGKVSGDKAKYNRERRKRIARREEMRALRAMLAAKGVAAPQAKTGKTTQAKGPAAAKI